MVKQRLFEPESAIVVRASYTSRKITEVTVTTKPLISGKCKTNVILFTELSFVILHPSLIR